MFLLYNASNMCVGEEEEKKKSFVGWNESSFLFDDAEDQEREREREKALTTLLTMFLKISPFSG